MCAWIKSTLCLFLVILVLMLALPGVVSPVGLAESPAVTRDLYTTFASPALRTMPKPGEPLGPNQAGSLPFPPNPPVASLITVGPPDVDGNALITGAVGAVEPNAYVLLASPDTARMTVTQALADGSFEITWFAPPGAWIQVKQSYEIPDPPIDLPESDPSHLSPLPGTMVRAPVPPEGPPGALPFAIVGVIRGAGSEGSWGFQGHLVSETIGMTVTLTVSGTLRVSSEAITSGTTISDGQVTAELELHRFFGADGQRVPVDGVLVSNFNTPTGLPISRETSKISPIEGSGVAVNWTYSGGHTMVGTVMGMIQVPAGIEAGYYRPHVRFLFPGVPLGPEKPWARHGPRHLSHLPVVRLGTPEPPRLVWTLLNNTLSRGTRGTVALQDKGTFGIQSHIITQADTFIIPQRDARTGEPIAYSLEPFLPFISMAERSVAHRPQIPFQLPSGSLQVSVKRPDGAIDTLGPAPFVQSINQSLFNRDGKILDIGGGRIDDLYQLSTMDDAFDYVFPQFGPYTITMTGTVEDIWGNLYQGNGTYEIFVARPLILDSGQLPTTPYEVGDYFAPGLHVYPPVPADVEIVFTHIPNSDPSQALVYVVTGQANRFGYFAPNDVISITDPGEFRMDMVASYPDQDGTLWMGSATWGSVVERPGTPLVAHGRRGLDLAGPHDVLWFFHRLLGLNIEGLHSMYPYFTGDVLWGNQLDTWCGGEAIIPAVTIQDTVGDIQSIIEERWNGKTHSNLFEGLDFAGRVANNELPLFSTTEDGSDLLWSPGLIDQYGYNYRSSERPGVRVHETISEDSLGISYWRFDAEFGLQAGYEGDLPNDLKWEFGSSVFRLLSPTNPINEYAIYGSLWVLLPDNDPIGSRVTPPFQGAAGGPDGGPIMVLQGQDIDIFFMPKGLQPGDVLQLGNRVSFSGHVGPPLDSLVMVTVTSPSGVETPFQGQANKVGWFYDPAVDFVAEEVGVWTVHVQVLHDQIVPSTGLVPAANNTGGVLGSADGRYHFYVVEPDSPRLNVLSPQPGFLQWPGDPMTVTVVPINVLVPAGVTNAVVSYTIRMPGFILEQGTIIPAGNTFTILYDPIALHQDFPNLDLKPKDGGRPGLTDPVLISFLLAGESGGVPIAFAGTVFLDGEEVHVIEAPVLRSYLPLIVK
jgi:hypothetical protein